MSDDRKTLLNERLPAPPPRQSARETPRERAVRRLNVLVKRASTAGAAVNLAACIGYGVVDPLPEPSQCIDFDATQWFFATAERRPDGTIVVTVQSDFVARLDGTLGVSSATLVSSEPPREQLGFAASVVLVLQPAGALPFTIAFGATCDDVEAALGLEIDPAALGVDGGATPIQVELR